MKRAMRKLILAIAFTVLAGCITEEAETVTEIRTGVYAANEASNLPLPTSGYQLYVMGEMHGIREIKLLLIDYLKILHETAGVCDLVLEEKQVYEKDANEYVLGLTNTLCVDLCLRTDILTDVRAYNETLSDDEKITIHLVDVDSPLSAVHLHLERIHEEIGAPAEHVEIVPFHEFENWSEDEALALVDELAECTDDPYLLN